MYKPQPQETNPTNQPPVVPPQNPSQTTTALRVLALEGHFPSWLLEMIKSISPIEIVTYSNTLQAKEKVIGENFDLYLIPDRAVIEGISHQKFQPFPQNLLEPKDRPLPMYLNHPLDLSNQFSLPYGCTYYGMAFHKDAYPKPIKKWKDLFHSDDFSQADFPQDPELLYVLTLIADEQIGKTDKKLDFKTPANPQENELPIRIRTLSELYKLSDQNPHWQVILPEDGSAIELYYFTLGTNVSSSSKADTVQEILKKIINPLQAAKLSEENNYASTFKSVLSIQSQPIRKKLVPDSKWSDKAIFIRPPKASRVNG